MGKLQVQISKSQNELDQTKKGQNSKLLQFGILAFMNFVTFLPIPVLRKQCAFESVDALQTIL